MLRARVVFFNDTATTEIYTLSLHDALPISRGEGAERDEDLAEPAPVALALLHVARAQHAGAPGRRAQARRSEEHTSELQSRSDLVCRLLLEKKNVLHHVRSKSVKIYKISII